MSLLLSRMTGEVVTAAELLGEPEPGTGQTDLERASQDLERKLAARRRRQQKGK